MLKRDDMLELTRRMNTSRTCFSRVAGAYLDREGFIDGTFNTGFLKLKPKEMEDNLKIAKAIPFSKTNVNLKEYDFADKGSTGQIKQLLNVLIDCGLKNDAMMDVFYELIGENYEAVNDYCVFMFFGRYDIPMKAADNSWLEGSEEVYEYMICALCPQASQYEPGKPEFGFLYPSFRYRSVDFDHIAVFNADSAHPNQKLMSKVLGLKIE